MSGMNAFSASNRATGAVRTERFAWTVSTFRRLRARDSASLMGWPETADVGGGREGRPFCSGPSGSGRAGGRASVAGSSIARRGAGKSPARSPLSTTAGSRRASAATAICVLVPTPSSLLDSPHAIAVAHDGPVVDVDSRRHPRTDSILVVLSLREPDPNRQALHDPDEIPRGVIGGEKREHRAGASRGALDPASKRFLGDSVEGNQNGVAGLDAVHLVLAEVGHHPDVIEVKGHDAQERLLRRQRLAEPDGPPADDPTLRCADEALAQVELRGAKRRLGLI